MQYEFQVHNFENNDMETFKLIIDDKTITDYQDLVFAEQDKPKEAVKSAVVNPTKKEIDIPSGTPISAKTADEQDTKETQKPKLKMVAHSASNSSFEKLQALRE